MAALSGAAAGQRRTRLSVSDRESPRFAARSGTQRARERLVLAPTMQTRRLRSGAALMCCAVTGVTDHTVTMAEAGWRNRLYYGDNLEVLQTHIPAASVDLVYLDPPFNSNRDYT